MTLSVYYVDGTTYLTTKIQQKVHKKFIQLSRLRITLKFLKKYLTKSRKNSSFFKLLIKRKLALNNHEHFENRESCYLWLCFPCNVKTSHLLTEFAAVFLDRNCRSSRFELS